MKPEEKAEELIEKFDECLNHIACGSNGIEEHLKERAKQCALICVDEITDMVRITDLTFWSQVKEEINKL